MKALWLYLFVFAILFQKHACKRSYVLYNSSLDCFRKKVAYVCVADTLKDSCERMSIYIADCYKVKGLSRVSYAFNPVPVFDIAYRIKGSSIMYVREVNAQIEEDVLFGLSDAIGKKRTTSAQCFDCPFETVLLKREIANQDTLFTYAIKSAGVLSDVSSIDIIKFDKNFLVKEVIYSPGILVNNKCLVQKRVVFKDR